MLSAVGVEAPSQAISGKLGFWMQYVIEVVAEGELPQGINKVVVERVDGPPLMLINGEPARVWRFMRSYEDTLEPCTVPTICLPAMPPLLRAV